MNCCYDEWALRSSNLFLARAGDIPLPEGLPPIGSISLPGMPPVSLPPLTSLPGVSLPPAGECSDVMHSFRLLHNHFIMPTFFRRLLHASTHASAATHGRSHPARTHTPARVQQSPAGRLASSAVGGRQHAARACTCTCACDDRGKSGACSCSVTRRSSNCLVQVVENNNFISVRSVYSFRCS